MRLLGLSESIEIGSSSLKKRGLSPISSAGRTVGTRLARTVGPASP
jgi:hypothetical protein